MFQDRAPQTGGRVSGMSRNKSTRYFHISFQQKKSNIKKKQQQQQQPI